MCMNDIITSTSNNAMGSNVAEAAVSQKLSPNDLEGSRPAPVVSQEPPKLDVPSSEEVFAAADRVTAFLQENNSTRSLRISMNETLDRAVFTVVDSETNEVVRHIPSDEVVAMAEFIEQWVPEAVR